MALRKTRRAREPNVREPHPLQTGFARKPYSPKVSSSKIKKIAAFAFKLSSFGSALSQ